jgi:hypothetical protein
LLLAISVGCEERKESVVGPVRYLDTNTETLDYTSHFEQIDFIQLGNAPNFNIGNISQLASHNDKWFVLDNEHRMALFSFDKNGTPIALFDRQGRGSDEYVGIFGFDLNPDSGEIILLCGPKLILLDENLNPTREFEVNTLYERAAFHGNGVLLYSYLKSRVDHLSFENEAIETVFEFEGDKENVFSPTDNIFVRENGVLYFHTKEVDKLFRVENKTFTSVATLDYEQKDKARQMYTDVGYASMSMTERFTYSRPGIMCVIERDGRLSLIFNKLVSGINIDNGDGTYRNWQISTLPGSIYLRRSGDGLVGWIQAFQYDKEQFNQHNRYDGIRVNHIAAGGEAIESNGNPILVIYKFKPGVF